MLLGTSASLLVTSALLVVTRTLLGAPGIATRSKNATRNKCKCLASSNKDASRGSWHRY